ncbi:MAG: 2-octaprenylphenol hydroxylase [Burkholderiales bacterium]|nr:2-octaprenylphenol hydroxylase [Burkholderiales bacterium]
MLRQTLGFMRELPRLHQIASVLIRHGLGDFVQRIGIAGVLERAGHILRRGEAPETVALDTATRLRMALEELGPTFVKLGQVMATRVDLFPPRGISELEKLHADVPAVAFEALVPELTRALGRSPHEVFRDIDAQAYGAASIAQVHRAKLQDGTPVVLKVRRPGVRETIDADLRLLRRVSELIDSEIPEARRYRPAEIAEQFAKSLEREADFGTETRNIERFAKNFEGDPHIVIPRIYPEFTSDVLLVQAHVEGIPATDIAGVEEASLDKKLLAARGVDAFLKMILLDGFFHADPHPGNVFYLPGNRIVIIDFGMVGRLSPQRRAQVIDLLGGLARMAEEPMLEVLLDWAGDAYVDEARLAADVNEMVFDYEGVPLRDIRVGNVIRQFAAIVRSHSIVLPSDLSLMFKALITLEGLGRQYDPDFHIINHLTPLVKSALAERYQPAELMRRGRNAVSEFMNVVGGVPRDLARLLRDTRRGKTRVDLDLKRLDSFGRQLDRTLDRVTVGIMTASLVIGSAIVLTVRDGPVVLGVPVLPALGLLGDLLAVLNSLWIVYGIWRSSRE